MNHHLGYEKSERSDFTVPMRGKDCKPFAKELKSVYNAHDVEYEQSGDHVADE